MELQKFKSIVVPLREKLQNFARSMLNNNGDAEDAVQETLLRLWSKKDSLDNHPNISGYTMQILKNICIDKIRSEKNTVSLDNVSIAEDNINPYSYTEQMDSSLIIKNIINSLPELQRKIIWMRDVEDYELGEIADIICSEVTAVRVNLSRARKKVRDQFLIINKTIK